MSEDRKQLLQQFIESFHQYMRLMGSTVLCPDKLPEIPKSQLLLLFSLNRNKQMSIKEIAKDMRITSSAATQLVEHIVESGLAERVESGNDRRQVHVQLTGEGVRQTLEYKAELVKRLDILFDATSNEALEQIIEFQQTVVTNKHADDPKKGYNNKKESI